MVQRGGIWTRIVQALGAVRPTRVGIGGLAALTLLAVGAAPAGAVGPFGDRSGQAFQILAPGEEGGLSPGPFSTDQGKLYNALTPLQGKVSQKNIEKDFISEKFGVQGPVIRTENPKPGLEILR